jgi:hypothetical protein
MKSLKILVIVMIFLGIAIFGSEIGERLSVPGTQGLLPAAEAIVGRPLTPVSVAGVARRTVRRCAVGIYCSIPGTRSSANLLMRTNNENEMVYFERHQTVTSFRSEDVRLAAQAG